MPTPIGTVTPPGYSDTALIRHQNGLNPEAYRTNIIDRMAKGHPINCLSELLPWNWKQKETARV